MYVAGLDCITRQYMTWITTHLCYEICQMSVYVCICHRDRLGIKTFVYIRLYDRTLCGMGNMTLMDVYVTGQCYIGHYVIRTCHRVKLYHKGHKRFMYVYHMDRMCHKILCGMGTRHLCMNMSKCSCMYMSQG